jgi:predicted lipoprotein
MFRGCIFAVAVLAGIGLLTWVFPLFHIVPLDTARASKMAESRVDPAVLAEHFWREQLPAELTKAHDLRAVLDAIATNVQSARHKYGRTVGISNSFLVLVQGTARVVGVDSKNVALSVRGDGSNPDVLLRAGLISGNSVRDVTGLLNMNDFANSQDFNEIALQLNRIVEERVLPEVRERAVVGQDLQFIGCAEITGDTTQKSLKVIPLRVGSRKPEQSK